jgi:hypothetical protein
MSQFYPSFTEHGAGVHGGAAIQTKRQSFTGTGSPQSVSLTWDSPFADTNYTVVISIESPAGNGPITYPGVVTKSSTGITVADIEGNYGLSYVLHAVAFHD